MRFLHLLALAGCLAAASVAATHEASAQDKAQIGMQPVTVSWLKRSPAEPPPTPAPQPEAPPNQRGPGVISPGGSGFKEEWTSPPGGSGAPGAPPPPSFPGQSGGPILLLNPSHTRTIVYYRLNGNYSYTMQSGQSQELKGDQAWTIDFQRGGSYGNKQYALEPGKTYRFKGTAQGWDLVPLRASPAVAGGEAPLPPVE